VVSYIDTDDLDQAFSGSNSLIETNSDSELVEQYRQSPRGDLRAMAAALVIEQECAELDREVAAPPVPPAIAPPVPPAIAPPVPPAISTGYTYVGDGWPAELSSFDPASAPPEFDRRLILIMRRADRASRAAKMKASRRAKAKRQPTAGRSITPTRQRAARARAVHSHAAHGGARKAGDDGDGGGDPPPPHPRSSRGQVSGAGL
jgi:hypothetical protein